MNGPDFRQSMYEARMGMSMPSAKSHAKISGVTDGVISGNSGYRDLRPLTASEWLERQIREVTHRAYA
jgi:hypothetical protein